MTCKVSPKCASILKHLYQKVETLEEFANGFAHVHYNGNLILAGDSQNYKRLLQSTLVCIPSGARCPTNVSPEVLSSQDDILERVIERLCKNSKKNQSKNLLTLGFQSLSENPHAQILPSSRIECTFTNHNASRLLLTPWKTFVSRVGDAVMEILLEHRAVLILADNSCYIQLTGVPLYNLISFKSSLPVIVKNKTTKFGNGIMQRKERGNFKSKKKSNDKMLTRPCSVPAVTDKCSNIIVDHIDIEENIEKKNNDSNSVCILDKSSSYAGNTNAEKRLSCRKRHIDLLDDDEYCSAKKLRLDNSLNEVANLTMDTPDKTDCYLVEKKVDLMKSVSERLCNEPTLSFEDCLNNSGSSSSVSFVSACESLSPCKQRSKITNLNLITRKDTNVGCKTDNIEQPDISSISTIFISNANQTGIIVDDLSTQDKRRRESCEFTRDEVIDVDNDLNNNMEYCIKKRKKRRRKRTDLEQEQASKSAFNNGMIIERARMMYSMNLSENYPPRYVFQKCRKTNIDGNELLADILKVDVQTEDECLNNEVKLPTIVKTRLVNMLDRFIKNNRACRYKYLLQFHAGSHHEFGLKNKLQKETKKRKKSANLRDIHKDKNNRNVVLTSEGPEGMHASKQLQSCSRYPGLIKGNVPVYRRGVAKIDDIPQVMEHAKKKVTESGCSDLALGSILSQVIHHRKVFLFVRACLIRVVPHELFGSIHNRSVFFKNVKRIISMRRFDKFSLGNLMLHMQPKCLWKSEMKSNHERLRLFAQILYWLMVSYVIPLLQSYFYVTDSAESRNHTFFFRKVDWRYIFQAGFANYLKRGILKPLTTKELSSINNTEIQSEIATFRFLPKRSSLRPIVRTSCKRTLGSRNKRSLLNWQHKDVLHVLKYETKLNLAIIGSSVFSRDDIYVTWKQFILNRVNRQDTRPLYFVKVDIKNCYDSIDKHKLYKIVEGLLSKLNTYKLRCYSRVFSEGGRLRRIFETEACALGSYQPSFLKYVTNFVETKGAGSSVFVDQCLQYEFHSQDLLDVLQKHMFECVIKINNKYYLQAEGISQGSVLSTMLCNLYYGDMESTHLKINKDEELLMRLVDDFIFVTPDLSKATEFVRRMNDGIPEYGCFVNKAKTLVTFDYVDDSVKRLPKGCPFPWCGLLIDTDRFDVRADYAPYKAICVSDSVTVDTSVSPGKSMRQKLLFAMRGKCHAIFLDASINSLPVVVENIFHIFLLSAFKFHSYVTRLPVPESANKNPNFFVEAILETSLFLWRRLIRLKCNLGWLNEPCVRWLCIKSYVLKLKCHCSTYNRVLKNLKKLLKDLESLMNEIIVNNLQTVVGDAMPEMFCDIMN